MKSSARRRCAWGSGNLVGLGGAVSFLSAVQMLCGVGREGEADRGRMRREDEARPSVRGKLGELREVERLGVGSIEGIGKRLLERGELGDLRVLGECPALGDEGGHVPAEPAGAPLIRRIAGDIGLHQIGEGAIAEIGVELLVVLAENLGEPRDIGVAVDAEQDFALFLGAVVDLGKDRVVAGQDAALETRPESP